MAVGVLLAAVGCASRESDQRAITASQQAEKSRDFFFRFDDPRCSEAQRHAIRAATKAVIGTDQPSASVAEYLHFSCTMSKDGWSLTVWHYGPNEPAMPGGFTSVDLNRDFTVKRVMGGA